MENQSNCCLAVSITNGFILSTGKTDFSASSHLALMPSRHTCHGTCTSHSLGSMSGVALLTSSGFLNLVQKLDLLVLLRPGPYICAEWDFGGFPWWLASSAVAGGGKLQLRIKMIPPYLAHVERWWNVLLRDLLHTCILGGAQFIMVQIENEFGFIGPNLLYLKDLLRIARATLGDDVIIYTTDPPPHLDNGTIPGPDVYTAVDFGAGWFDLNWAFSQQRAYNAPGKSPPLCTEFYTGWLTTLG
eukprot:jgi/Botrbrau1/12595/Bobra.0169s0123.1